MKLISKEVKDGFLIETYDNGAVVKSAYSDEHIAEPLEELSEIDEAILNTNANVEYLVALKELEV